MNSKKTVKDIDVKGKRVLVRADFNVPLKNGIVQDDTRIRAALPTIQYLLSQSAKIILTSHLGRPKGQVVEEMRLNPVADKLGELLGRPIKKLDEIISPSIRSEVENMVNGDILLLENVRFDPGEQANDDAFARELASLADVYVNDAFGTAHRAHASTVGVTKYLPSVAGLLLKSELNHLSALLEDPEPPFYAVLGGNKVSDKILVIEKLLDIVDGLMTGGGMCFTFLKAKGFEIGSSICQEEELEHSKAMLEKAASKGVDFFLPTDVVVAPRLEADAPYRTVPASEIPEGWMGLDIGPETIAAYIKYLQQAKTIFWNGPLGVFELEHFAAGTRDVGKAIASSGATSVIGGGDTDAALKKFDLEDDVSFISTGGGASLKMLEGSPLPAVEALMAAEPIKVKNQ